MLNIVLTTKLIKLLTYEEHSNELLYENWPTVEAGAPYTVEITLLYKGMRCTNKTVP